MCRVRLLDEYHLHWMLQWHMAEEEEEEYDDVFAGDVDNARDAILMA